MQKNFGDVVFGVSGTESSTVQLIRVVTGSKNSDPDLDASPEACFCFLWDCCRNETRNASMIVKDKGFEQAIEFQKNRLNERILEICSSQIGHKAADGNSLVHRMGQFINDSESSHLKLSQLNVFNKEATQKLWVKWPEVP